MMLRTVLLAALSAAEWFQPVGRGPAADRFPENPLIGPALAGSRNINGPSLIRVPAWAPQALGKYYLYFADHGGQRIHLAYADALAGPWKIYEPGVLALSETRCRGHIASPDVHVDQARRRIRMYFHGPVEGQKTQMSLVALSADGLHFTASPELLGESYFRVFQWGGFHYAICRAGKLYRSRGGLRDFEPGPALFPEAPEATLRHCAVKLDGGLLSIYYSVIGDRPERILLSTVRLGEDWRQWKPSRPLVVLEPGREYEGADLPLAPSRQGPAKARLRELRDPAIFTEDGKTYLLYSVAGESGIAIAVLRPARAARQ